MTDKQMKPEVGSSNLDHSSLSQILEVIRQCESALSLASSYRDITRAHEGERIEAALSSARSLIDAIRASNRRRIDETAALLSPNLPPSQVIERHNGEKAVKIEPNRYGEGWDIRTMRNGFQWSGMTGDLGLLTMLRDALNETLVDETSADLTKRPALEVIRRVCEGRGSVEEGLRVADYVGKLEGVLSGRGVGATVERSIASAHSANGVARRAREFRDKRGHWGSHAEALCAEVERLHKENHALRNLAENLRPGPISQALADEQCRAAVEMANAPK